MPFDKEKEAALNNFYGQIYNSTTPHLSPASPSVGNYPLPMYNNKFTRYPVPLSMQQQQKISQPLRTMPPGSTPTHTANSTPHLARQLTYAQISRQSASPHHHARTAAAVARSAPVASTVTIVDPNNPAKTLNGLLKKQEDDPRLSASSNQSWTALDIGGMGLKNVSSSLFSYTFLTVLYMSHNELTSLTPAIVNLVNLKILDASGNKLDSLPPELGMLINLRELLLFDNNLTDLPNELGTLYQLEILGLEGNPMDDEIKNLLVKEGSQAVILSLRDQAPVGVPPSPREWVDIENCTTEMSSDKFSYVTSQAYPCTPSWALNWEYRKELLISEILGWNTDIICLQEVEMCQYDELLQDHFKQVGDYESVYYPKTRAKTMAENERRAVDGCATFYKTSRFRLIENYLLEYNQNALQRADFKKTEDIYNRVMNKDNIAVLTMLEKKDTNELVLVANSHIHWDPTFADVKLVQVGMLMDEIERFAAKHARNQASRLPTIICGDFNSAPDSGVYEFLSKSTIQQGHDDFGDYVYGNYTTEGLSHKLSLKSAYGHLGELPFTDYTVTFKGVLDYIWYTNSTLDVLSLLGPVDNNYLKNVIGFPNAHFPSE
ncbi:Glucose-repressible alcohol dehydrogenase transcriptional effector [Apophysomyces sp. BC1034]|nr:Glucose-repressible alcohol dehydrogenase transcriptional effector [Apophysomyces sp. BC1034]